MRQLSIILIRNNKIFRGCGDGCGDVGRGGSVGGVGGFGSTSSKGGEGGSGGCGGEDSGGFTDFCNYQRLSQKSFCVSYMPQTCLISVPCNAVRLTPSLVTLAFPFYAR